MSILPRLLSSLLVGSAVVAQCAPQWQPGDPVPHASGSVAASVVWDPDGAGPAPLHLVCGGKFSAGSMIDVAIAAYDGTQWLPLGTPPGTAVTAMASWNGLLFVASVNGLASTISAWNGSGWAPVGFFGSVNGRVETMVVHDSQLVVGGWFSHVDGVAAANIASFDGVSWTALGSGTNGIVLALATFGSALHVGGDFTNAGGVTVSHHALWNNSTWFVGATFNGPVETFAVRAGMAVTNTYLFAGGVFTTVGLLSVSHVARLTMSTNLWTAVGSGIAATTCKRLFVRSTGISTYDLTAAVEGGSDMMWRLSGAAWNALGVVDDAEPTAAPRTMADFGGAYLLGLQNAAHAVRKFDGANHWAPVLGRGLDERVSASCSIGSDLVIAGSFRTISGVVMNGIARGTPGNWSPLGTGLEGGFGAFAVVVMPNGDLVAAGNFTIAGGVAANNVARWNGTSWVQFGGGANDSVYALAVMPNGDLVAAGRFTSAGGVPCNRIARWNGTTWLPLGTGSASQINALHVAANGDLLVGGNFTTIGGVAASRIARWNGSTWSALGSGVNNAVWTVVTTPNGHVFVGGAFTMAGATSTEYVARWNGTAWSPVGIPFGYRPETDVLSLAALPDGDVVAVGGLWTFSISFPLPVSIASNVARWDGASDNWQALAVYGSFVQHARALPEGGLVVGGIFDRAGGLAVGNFAKLALPCPAIATPFGAGCSGDTLTAVTLPWVESTFRAVGTGLPATAIVLTATSVTPVPQSAAPLSLFFGQASPGCDLLVAPDILGVLVTTTGTVLSELQLPNSPPLVGVTFLHQLIPIAVDAQGAWTAVTATNALQLTAGIF